MLGFATIANSIAVTTTETGRKVHAGMNAQIYQAGINVTDQQLARVKLRRAKFHGDWNCEAPPRPAKP